MLAGPDFAQCLRDADVNGNFVICGDVGSMTVYVQEARSRVASYVFCLDVVNTNSIRATSVSVDF